MDKKKTPFREQEAPEKNTDKAFVKVNRDGSPEMPGRDQSKNTSKNKDQEKRPRK